MQTPEDDALVQQRMVDLFESYLEKKPAGKPLAYAQALLRDHRTNRTEREKTNFTIALTAVCARRDAAFAAARPLARLMAMARSMGRDQAIADCAASTTPLDVAALERDYVRIFTYQRIPEALTFYLARHYSSEELQEHVAFLQAPAVVATRARIKRLLQDTAEADPCGLDWVGHSLANHDIAPPGAEPVPEALPEVEGKVRMLMDATCAPAVSRAGFAALCRGLTPADLNPVLAGVTAATYRRLLQGAHDFATTLPGVRHQALTFALGEALRDHFPRPTRRRADSALPAPT